MDSLAQSLKASPEVYPHTLDPAGDTVAFIRMTREAFAAASFLDARLLTPQTPIQQVPWPDAEAAVAAAGLEERCQFIFHIGHVGSTLMSRLLAADPAVLALREPLPLRVLAQAHEVLAEPESLWSAGGFERRLDAMLRLWSRGFEPSQTAVVKATSFCCGMAQDLLARPGKSRALFMFTAPEVYLATLLGGANNHLDIRSMAAGRLRRLHRRIGGPRWRLSELSYGEMAAMSWACEMAALADAAEACPGQGLWVDFERLLARPQSQLAAAFAHLGVSVGDEAIAGIVAGPEMGRYSKAPEHAYDAALRARVLAQAREAGGKQIRAGLDWLDRAAAGCPPIAAALAAAAGR